MGRNRGGITTVLVIIIAVVMLAATAWLVLETLKKRSAEHGLAYLRSGDYTQAALCLERAARYSLRPDAAVLFHLAEARLKLGGLAEAKSGFERVISLEPRNAAARYELGKIYIGEKNFGAARSEITALEEIGTEEAKEYADELKGAIQTGAVKGFFNELLKKILPGGIPDALNNTVPETEE